MVQGELFREEHAGTLLEAKPKSFLAQYQISITFDKVLIGCIGFVIIFALTYSFGVEKGKRAMEKKMETYLGEEKQPAAQAPATLTEVPPEAGIVLKINQEPLPAAVQPVEPTAAKTVPEATRTSIKSSLPLADQARTGTYTIQLVTYGTEAQALREIERLKTRGFSGFVIPSGRYFQVCVNYFENKDLAKNAFKRLREEGRYPGAFVRPVVR